MARSSYEAMKSKITEQFEDDIEILIESDELERSLLIPQLARKYGIKKDILIHHAFFLSAERRNESSSAKRFFDYAFSDPIRKKRYLQFESDKVNTAWKFDVEKGIVFLRKDRSFQFPIPSTAEELGATLILLFDKCPTDIKGFIEMIEYYHFYCPISSK